VPIPSGPACPRTPAVGAWVQELQDQAC